MTKLPKTVLSIVGATVALGAAGTSVFAYSQARAFDASMEKVYDVPLPAIERSTDPAVLARGKHVAESIAGCAGGDCHSADFGGGRSIVAGPVGTFTAPNVTTGGLGAVYTDAELARLIRHGIKRDGRSVMMMPVQEFGWMPDSDVVAVVSYVRSLPKVDRPNGPVKLGPLGKIIDRQDKFVIDVARRISHETLDIGPSPTATAEYGAYVARLCKGCHGSELSGGPIPGAPPSMPTPLNLTPDKTGLAGWTYADFDKLVTTGVRKNGKQLDPFMPVETTSKFDDTEKRALFAYLQALPPRAFGGR
jgi:hypothetical protein